MPLFSMKDFGNIIDGELVKSAAGYDYGLIKGIKSSVKSPVNYNHHEIRVTVGYRF